MKIFEMNLTHLITNLKIMLILLLKFRVYIFNETLNLFYVKK